MKDVIIRFRTDLAKILTGRIMFWTCIIRDKLVSERVTDNLVRVIEFYKNRISAHS